MTKQEFTQRVLVEVSDKEFEAINEVYMNSDLEKDAFCKVWKKMNKTRVDDAKRAKEIEAREEAARDSLFKWFTRTHEAVIKGYCTPIAYTDLTCREVVAMSHAGIMLEDSFLGDVRFRVGRYLGIIR